MRMSRGLHPIVYQFHMSRDCMSLSRYFVWESDLHVAWNKEGVIPWVIPLLLLSFFLCDPEGMRTPAIFFSSEDCLVFLRVDLLVSLTPLVNLPCFVAESCFLSPWFLDTWWEKNRHRLLQSWVMHHWLQETMLDFFLSRCLCVPVLSSIQGSRQANAQV
jgi:hypothetical protein